MNVCCWRIKGLLPQATKQETDFYVRAKRQDEGARFFVLGARFFADGHRVELEVAIHYCPTCGSDLNRLITADPDGFDALVEEYLRTAPPPTT